MSVCPVASQTHTPTGTGIQRRNDGRELARIDIDVNARPALADQNDLDQREASVGIALELRQHRRVFFPPRVRSDFSVKASLTSAALTGCR